MKNPGFRNGRKELEMCYKEIKIFYLGVKYQKIGPKNGMLQNFIWIADLGSGSRFDSDLHLESGFIRNPIYLGSELHADSYRHLNSKHQSYLSLSLLWELLSLPEGT